MGPPTPFTAQSKNIRSTQILQEKSSDSSSNAEHSVNESIETPSVIVPSDSGLGESSFFSLSRQSDTSATPPNLSISTPSELTSNLPQLQSTMANDSDKDILTCNKLTATNWLNWRYRIRAILKLKKLLSVVDTKPTAELKQVATYDDQNTRACLYITQYLPDDILSTVQHLEDSYDIWQALQALHEGSGASKIARIFDSMFHLSDTYSNATTHVGQLRQFAADIDAADKLDGKTVARYFGIKTLPRQFDPLKPVLMNMHDKSFDAVCNLIIDYERSNFQEVLAAAQHKSKHLQPKQQRKFQTNKPLVPGQNDSTQQHKQGKFCKYCKNHGHLKEECRKLAEVNKKGANPSSVPKTDQKTASQPAKLPTEQMNSFGWLQCMTEIHSSSSTSSSITPNLSPDFTDLFFEDELDECSFTNNISSPFEESVVPALMDKAITLSEKAQPFICNCSTQSKLDITNSWWLDSGATQHATNNKCNLHSVKPCQLSMGGATGNDLNIQAVGSAVVGTDQNFPLFLSKCYFSPDLIGNFLSVSKLTDTGISVNFNRNSCSLFKDGTLIAEGLRSNDMYAIKTHPINRLCAVSNTPLPEQTPEEYAMSWHRALNHLNFTDLFKLREQLGLRPCRIRLQCETCQMAKCHKQPFPSSNIKSTAPLDLIHSDVSGIIRLPSHSLFKYFLTFVDDYSRYTHLYLLKSREEVLAKFIEFQALVERQLDSKIKVFRSDNGTEYTNNAFVNHLKKCGIEQQFTHVHSPQENGVSERLNRTIEEGARAALLDSKLPIYYWPFAVKYALHVKNRLPHSAIQYKIPFEIWFKRQVNFKLFRPFGCAVVAYDPETTNKFQPTGIPGRFLGYSIERKGFLVLRNDTKAVFPSRHITVSIQNQFCTTPTQINADEINNLFWETDPPETQNSDDLNPLTQLYDPSNSDDLHINDNTNESSTPASPPLSATDQLEDECDHENFSDLPTPEIESDVAPEVIGEDAQYIFLTKKEYEDYVRDFPTSTLTRTTGFMKKPNVTNGGPGRRAHAHRYMINCLTLPGDVRAALSGQEAENWKRAMRDEYNSLIQNGTWTLVKRPDNIKPVPCKWVLKKKYDDGEMIYKARLVAKGFSQRQGVDYFDTFSPVIRISSVRLLLSFAIHQNLYAHHIDVKTAFLNGELAEEVYMLQPPLFADDDQRDLVCRLNRSIYGLKQSARCWNDRLTQILHSFKLIQMKSDPCIFVAPNRSLIVGIYVDDMLVIAKTVDLIREFESKLAQHVNITYKGPARNFLGIEIEYIDGQMHLSQRRQINDILEEHEMDESKGKPTPMATGTELTAEPDQPELPESFGYRSVVGSLLHLANYSRPDISFAVGQLCRFMASPKESHLNAAKRVLRYLQRTKTASLIYRSIAGETCIYNDADYNNSEESFSTSGVCVFHMGNLVNWMSQRQTIVTITLNLFRIFCYIGYFSIPPVVTCDRRI